MSCWALLALKTAASAKGRLAEILPPAQRVWLVHRMLAQVVCTLQTARHIAGIAVVTGEVLAQPGLWRIEDPGNGLNAALEHGAAQLAARGIDEILLLHADLPLVRPEEIDTLIEAGRRHGLALATDKLGQGSNALYAPLPLPIPLRFGPDSCRQHQDEAARRQHPLEVLRLPGLAFDIDEPRDLQHLCTVLPQHYGDFSALLAAPPLP